MEIPPDAQTKKKLFKRLIFGSPLKIIFFILWAILMISTPFGVRMDFGSPQQPPIVFVALMVRNFIFFMAVFCALRPESFQKVYFIILAVILGFVSFSILFTILQFAALGMYLISEILTVRQLEPAVNFLARPPQSPQSQSRKPTIILIVILEMVGYVAVTLLLDQVSTGFYVLDTAQARFGYIVLPAWMMFIVAVILFSIIATKKDPFHARLQKQFTVIIPIILAMALFLAYRFWLFAQGYQSHDPNDPVVTYGITETLNAFLLVFLTVWNQYDKAGKKGQNRRSYAYILWIYTLTLYNVWFDPVFEAQGMFMAVLTLTGIGVYFMVRSLAKEYAERIGIPRGTRFRHLLFREQKPIGVISMEDVKWGDGRF